VASVLIWFVLQSMVGSDHPDAKSLDLYTCCCLLGYSLVPMVFHAVLALLLPRWAQSGQGRGVKPGFNMRSGRAACKCVECGAGAAAAAKPQVGLRSQ